MAVSDYRELRNKLRTNARDTFSVQWSDTALDSIINDAQREYSFYAQNLVGELEIKSSASGVIRLPEDFISPIKCISSKGEDIPIVSWRELTKKYNDFRKCTGEKIQCLCFDYDGYSFVRIFPRIAKNIFCGKLIYTRYAVPDKIETQNIDAVKEHCLFQMSFTAANKKCFEHYNNFMRLIDNENRSNHTLNIRRKPPRGIYY